MLNGRLRNYGYGLLLLGLVGALLLTWLLFNVVVLSVFGSATVFFLLLSWVIWDGVRQTSPESLAARGASPNDDALKIMDPGLRREYAPFVPFAGRAQSARRSRVRAVAPPRPSRPAVGSVSRRDQDRPECTRSPAGRNAAVRRHHHPRKRTAGIGHR